MDHFADRYTVAAIDVRGYGGSSKPIEIERYSLQELATDTAAVIDAMGGSAIVVGHDWGAPIAWQTARLHADRVTAVAGLSVPYLPVGPVSSMELWDVVYADKFFYMKYFQAPGVAEAELSADTARSLRMIWYSASADGRGALIKDKPADATMLEGLVDPDPFPAWSTPEDRAVYVEAFEAGGWTGPLNRYRAQGIDAEQLGSQTEPPREIRQPATFIGGEFDPVRRFAAGVDLFADTGANCADFRGATIVPGAGHWVQQEAPAATNAALDAFVDSL
jgi:pimeloyl-ACP methyl ester carboxylesterase